MTRLSLFLILLAPLVFAGQARAQVLTFAGGTPTASAKNKGYVTVQGNVNLTNVQMKFVTVIAYVNGGKEPIVTQTPTVDQKTGAWGPVDVAGVAGTYTNGDTLQVLVIGVNTGLKTNYYLSGSSPSGK